MTPWRPAEGHFQVKLQITNDAFCIVQRAIAQSKTGSYCGYGVAEDPSFFKASWPGCIDFISLFLRFISSS
jgi:hypothetical protein